MNLRHRGSPEMGQSELGELSLSETAGKRLHRLDWSVTSSAMEQAMSAQARDS